MKIKVRYSHTAPDGNLQIYNHALTARVLETGGCSDKLFLFQRSTPTLQGDYIDEFIQIATPLDTYEIPEDAPDLANGMPYFRRNEVTLWFRTQEDLQLAKKKMEEDFIVLSRTFDTIMCGMDNEEEKTYG